MSGGLYSISLPVLDAQNSQLLFRLKTWKCTRSKRSKGKTARQKILDSNHWNHQASRTVLDQLLTENWSKSKTNFSRSQFISPCNKLSSFCGWRTRNYALSSVSANTKSKQTNFIKISFNEIKNRDYHLPGLFLTLSSTSGACFLAPKNIPSNCRVIEKLLFWRQTQSWNSWNRSSANIDSVLVEILPRQHRKVS